MEKKPENCTACRTGDLDEATLEKSQRQPLKKNIMTNDSVVKELAIRFCVWNTM